MKRYWLVLFVILLALVLAACGGQQEPGAGETEAPAEEAAESPAAETAGEEPAAEDSAPAQVRVGWGGSPDTLNPGLGVLAEAYTIYELVYDSMVQIQLDGSYTWEVAEDAQVSEDGTVWTFTLRDGITFHDGEPLTADDVVFSYNLYQSQEEFPYMPVYTEFFESVEAPDEKTVVITLSEAIPNMESQLYYMYILPEHIWSQVEDPAAFENAEMIGSGPFKLNEYRQNEFVVLDAVQDHYLYPPKIDGAVFQTFDSQDALVQALKTGQVDMITEMPATAVASLRSESDVELVTGPPLAPDITDIIFNVTSEENCPDGDGVCSGIPLCGI